MKSDNTNSGSNSAATSAATPPPEAPATELTEAQYLAQQAANARLAMTRVYHEATVRLGQGADPTQWARQYPWITVGAAAVGGFVLASSLIPSKVQQALKKLAVIEQALNPPPASANGHDKKEERSLLATLALEAFAILRPLLTNLIASAAGGPPARHDGHDPGQTMPPDSRQQYSAT